MPTICHLPLLLSYFICLNSAAQSGDSTIHRIRFGGYIKNIQSTYFVQNIDSNASATIIHNRINLRVDISKKWYARMEFRNRIFYGEQIRLTQDFGNNINQYEGLLKLSHLWVNGHSFVAQSLADRMLLNYSDDKWGLFVGRQRINWGIHNIWNPNDIFNAYNFLDFDYEERPGTDAIRIQRNLKSNSALEMAFAPGRRRDKHTAAALYKFNRKKYDFQILCGVLKSDFVIGGGWAGSIKDAGFKGEWCYFIPQNNSPMASKNLSVSLMADITSKNNWYLSISVLYNSHPANLLSPGGAISNANLSAKRLFPFRHTLYLSASKSISPIKSISLSGIYSPEKNTVILIPNYSWNIAQSFDVDLIAQVFFANKDKSYVNLISQLFIRGRWSF